MQNRNDIRSESETDLVGGHGPLMGRDIMAAALLTIAAGVCMVIAWSGGSSVDSAKVQSPATEISSHQRPN